MRRRVEDDEDYEEEEDVPLQHRRPFGAGISRKPIQFVKASDPNLSTTQAANKTKSGASVGDFYLSLVLGDKKQAEAEKPSPAAGQVCAVCELPVDKDDGVREVGNDNNKPTTSRQKQHESSIAHQVCLTHSHPPSALDRSRMGLTYLSSHGWDPDSRKGLGAEEQGMQYPLKTRPKEDKYGLGLKIPKGIQGRIEKKKPQMLDAKQCRKKADEDKRKAERLREMFYASEDIDKYLGTGS
ncbi:G-patch domain-containing protein [Colletotrichum costaricense]|uniref:G-patch domain-containing protein n=1 Tax=Colletotrichum costaricense TaxID=1209916 RepID=A0AAI9YT01_9PEZI|nr:G-patch domain-containing protein [Colletotrichum costaricense]KAK1522163.1 G-patch domain-containing protein [Colletotrichum costaricense]